MKELVTNATLTNATRLVGLCVNQFPATLILLSSLIFSAPQSSSSLPLILLLLLLQAPLGLTSPPCPSLALSTAC
ncbi:MAG: hypothetical protein J3R72DRAFT_454398 [Linnemannia gamsii]|nr:MAG: hypothetical protein J3R72DRAFT_454398 [Linnemannia gamsii]